VGSPFVAEIRIVGFNFPPVGWAYCNGQLMPISQNTALFSLLGTIYGGDGKSTFALPDLQGNVPIHWGQGQGLSLYDEGQVGGQQAVTLLETEMPAHSHTMQGINTPPPANSGVGSATSSLARSSGTTAYDAGPPTIQMAPQSLTVAGGSLPHNNMMPTLVLNFIIALQGVFPPRP
jgi:microcystin-dependent protein